MVKVMDSCALLAYLEKEEGYEVVKELLIKATGSGKYILMTTVNLGEIIYLLYREFGENEGGKIIRIIETFPIEIVPVDMEITRQAAIYKASRKMSYADCFAAALTKINKGELITSDKEFKEVEKDIRIHWIR